MPKVNDEIFNRLARDWIEAWNRRDLDGIVSRLAEEVEYVSPFVPRLTGSPEGRVVGKSAVGEYVARWLVAHPKSHFKLLSVFSGVRSLTVHYRSVDDLTVSEVLTLSDSNLIVHVQQHCSTASFMQAQSHLVGPIFERRRGDYVLTDDRSRLELDDICELLHETYWANDRPREVIEKSLLNSECLHLIHGSRQVGLIRGVTDYSTFTWVCDVVVHPEHRGMGLGKWLMQSFLENPRTQTISQHLCTRDAHGLYEEFGFQRIEAMRRSKRPMEFLLRPAGGG